MNCELSRLAVIPARGGSKRIPRKNIRSFCGRPIISYSIEAALQSNVFDSVIVSTDDEEIAQLSKEYGAEVPFLRPASLSDDHTGLAGVMKHAVQSYMDLGAPCEHACCIFATSPFIEVEDIVTGGRDIQEQGVDYLFSATTFASPIQRAFRLSNDDRVSMFNPENFEVRSQDLEQAWHDAGQFYWGTVNAWLSELPIFLNNSSVVKIPRDRVQDIDDFEDWRRAEFLYRYLQAN